MPITDCPTHGTHACTEVCEHLAEAHANGVYVVPVVLPVLPIDLCALCVREHRVDALPSGDEGLARIQAVYDAVNVRSRLICDACRDATRVAHARSTGAELPCEPFEHTLTDADDPRLDALAELIRSHLSPRGNHAGRFHGCQVFPGTALRPVLVRMFGVGDDDARSAMTERIDRYFDGIDAFQRKLEYYEAMAWEDQEVDGAVTRVRKPLVLIDEVLRRVAPQP
ncbi:MAG: hypothetical protein H6734_21955 [Alphaproteobacteria bacterium]|nr:hypothetical protein [Alphaproteobacteria bacterium]